VDAPSGQLAHELLGAVAMVQVNVEDGHVADAVRRGRIHSATDDIVHPAKARWVAAIGVVAGRAHHRKRALGARGTAHSVDGVVRRADGPLQRCLCLWAQVQVAAVQRLGHLALAGLDRRH
jgi:hypothetical protein